MGQIKKIVKIKKLKGERYVCVEYKQSKQFGVIKFYKDPMIDAVDVIKGDSEAGTDFYLKLLQTKNSGGKIVFSIFIDEVPLSDIGEVEPIDLCFGPCDPFLIQCGLGESPTCTNDIPPLKCE